MSLGKSLALSGPQSKPVKWGTEEWKYDMGFPGGGRSETSFLKCFEIISKEILLFQVHCTHQVWKTHALFNLYKYTVCVDCI